MPGLLEEWHILRRLSRRKLRSLSRCFRFLCGSEVLEVNCCLEKLFCLGRVRPADESLTLQSRAIESLKGLRHSLRGRQLLQSYQEEGGRRQPGWPLSQKEEGSQLCLYLDWPLTQGWQRVSWYVDQLATQGSDLTASHDRSWCGLGASQARGGGQGLLCLEEDDCNVDAYDFLHVIKRMVLIIARLGWWMI